MEGQKKTLAKERERERAGREVIREHKVRAREREREREREHKRERERERERERATVVEYLYFPLRALFFLILKPPF
jgi:hypothetical protein